MHLIMKGANSMAKSELGLETSLARAKWAISLLLLHKCAEKTVLSPCTHIGPPFLAVMEAFSQSGQAVVGEEPQVMNAP